jgi:hypothetical protein
MRISKITQRMLAPIKNMFIAQKHHKMQDMFYRAAA